MKLSPAERQAKIKAVIRATSGNFLEAYDYSVYLYYAAFIAAAFFPTGSGFSSLLLSLLAFGIAGLARPVGALILGSYMDRKGRRKGLLLTLALMALGTLSITVTPPYAIIGLLAPLVVIAARLVQGFSLGVETGGVSVYLAEITTPGNRGFYVAWQNSSQNIGVILAATLGIALAARLSTEQMASFGWRIPLLVGCLIVPVLFWLRSSLEETEVFLKGHHARTTGEVLRIVSEHWPLLLIGTMAQVLNTVGNYFITAYTPTFGTQALHLTRMDSLLVTLCVGFSLFVCIPIGGALSDRIGRMPPLVIVPILMLATAYPAMAWLVAEPSFAKLLAVELWFSFLSSAYVGAWLPLLAEILPGKVRASGMALVLSLGNGIFGGFTPAVSTFLIEITGNSASPALWLSLCAGISLVGVLAWQRLAPGVSAEEVLT
jgi:MFS family permease